MEDVYFVYELVSMGMCGVVWYGLWYGSVWYGSGMV